MNTKNIIGELLLQCQECIYGGKNIFPNCLDFDPSTNCNYYNNVSDVNKCKYYVT